VKNSLPASALLKKLDQQHRILRPADAENGHAALATAYDHIRDSFAEIIQTHGGVKDDSSLAALCESLNNEQHRLLKARSEDAQIRVLDKSTILDLRRSIANARQYVRRQLEKDLGSENGQTSSPFEAIENLRRVLGLDPLQEEKTVEEQLTEIPEETRNAYRSLVQDFGMDEALLTHLLCVLHSDIFSYSQDDLQLSVSEWVGKCERRQEPAIPNLPPEIFIEPKLAGFRKIFFNLLRDKYLALFTHTGGLQKVRKGIERDIADITIKERERLTSVKGKKEKDAVQYEFALKRRFLTALIQYFEDLENLPHPQRLKNSISGDEPFPNRHQELAMYETAMMGVFFNAGEMGSGKTGAAIGTFEYLREQGKAHRSLILCPSGIVKVWQERLAETDNGYFRKGQKPKVAIINGDPRRRRQQLEEAKHADYVVIGIEMSRGETQAISHEEWMQAIGADFLIIDEVHNVKNPQKRMNSDTDRIYRISQSPSIDYRVLLSGTPIPNHRKDIAAQLRLLHAEPDEKRHRSPRLSAFEEFVRSANVSKEDAAILARFDKSDAKKTNGVVDVNFHDINQLVNVVEGCDTPITQHYLLPYLYRPRTADCLPVRAKLHPVIEDHYQLTATERLHYNRILANEELSLLQKVHMLHRVCLHAHAVPGVAQTGKSKFERLLVWLDEFLGEDNPTGKVVVTSPHYTQGVTQGDRTILAQLQAEYEGEDIKIFMLDGSQTGNQELRERDSDGSAMTKTKKIISAFRNHPGKAILLTQMDTVREGIDLSFVPRAIMLSPSWTRAEEDQFWRRFYRRGQENDVSCVKLVAENTLEEGINLLSQQKEEIGERLLNGRRLTPDELQLLDVGKVGGKANPFMWWTMLPPKEKLMVLWGQLMHKGENHVRQTMERLGPLFAELYNHDWETSYNGNTARLVGAIIDHLRKTDELPETKRRHLHVADIASGAFAVARTFRDREDVRVWSSDINPAMIGKDVGKRVMKGGYDERYNDVAAMDALPYQDGSKDIAVLSLGLHYAMHRDKPKKPGKERIRTVAELNRVLADGGIGIVTLPPSIFRGRKQQKFSELCTAFRHFGFEVVSGLSKHAVSAVSDDKNKFEIFVFTLKKIGEPAFKLSDEWEDIPEAVRKGLDLSKVKKTGGGGGERKKKKRRIHSDDNEGSYCDRFVLGADEDPLELNFEGSMEQKRLKARVQEKQELEKASPDLVQAILRDHQTLDDIPPERWLEIPLDVIIKAPQKIHDAYAQALIVKESRNITRDFLATLNDGQDAAKLKLSRRHEMQYLVISYATNSERKKTRRYLITQGSEGQTDA